jgi:YggT family protein
MAQILVRTIYGFANILVLLLMIRAILSWFARPGSAFFGAYRAMVGLTEPLVAPFRRMLSNVDTGMFDFSVLIAFFAIEIIAKILATIVLAVL